MSFKYQAPVHFQGTSVECAGQTYHITTKHTIESDVDIFYGLQPLGFTRAVPEPKAEPKKETAAAK